jgi:hypothetical protein
MPHDDGSMTCLELMELVDRTLLDAVHKHMPEPTPKVVAAMNAHRSYLYNIIVEREKQRRL